MQKHETAALPAFFKPILWSYEFDKIDPGRDYRIIIQQTINYGTLAHWRWAKEFYGVERIRDVIAAAPATAFRPQALRLAQLLFGGNILPHASRSAHR